MVDNIVRLHDGRNLGFSEYGVPEGVPLLLFHGTPGCRIIKRLEAASWTKKFGLRVIVPDRPGYGLSDPAPGRTIINWATDVEELADHLDLGRFHIAGASGGGAYALACAIQSPARVLSVSLLSSAGPPEVMPVSKDMNFGNKVAFFSARHAPFIIKAIFGISAYTVKRQRADAIGEEKNTACESSNKRLEKKLEKDMETIPEWDKRTMGKVNGEHAMIQTQEVFRQGGYGAYQDTLLISRPWGLNLDEVTVPVFMWHGTADNMVPISTARALSELIQGCETHFIQDAGHQLLVSNEICSQMAARILAVNA